jgi:hypothetical protein
MNGCVRRRRAREREGEPASSRLDVDESFRDDDRGTVRRGYVGSIAKDDEGCRREGRRRRERRWTFLRFGGSSRLGGGRGEERRRRRRGKPELDARG